MKHVFSRKYYDLELRYIRVFEQNKGSFELLLFFGLFVGYMGMAPATQPQATYLELVDMPTGDSITEGYLPMKWRKFRVVLKSISIFSILPVDQVPSI